MAYINKYYVLVTDESIEYAADTTSHPTEEGLPLSDTLRKQPKMVSLSGKIADVNGTTAERILRALQKYQDGGILITYSGKVGVIKSLQIQSFNTNYNNKNNGGIDFDMSLKEVRIAKRAYVKQKVKVTETKTTTSFKVGDKVRFKGGYVYVSSDAKKHSAKRGASTCKLTKISTITGRKHIYHLISEDCKYGSSCYVYGWVDASDVMGLIKTVSKTVSLGGTQQLQQLQKLQKLKD